MHYRYWLFAVVVAVGHLKAAETGLYDISDTSHPKALRDEIEQVTVRSVSNDNRRYSLAFRASETFTIPCTQVGLVVGSRTIKFNSQGVDGQGHFTSMETMVDDPEVVPEIAKHFQANVVRRRHPGHRMLVEIIPSKAEFVARERVTVKLRITNIGDVEFAFIQGGRQRGPRDNQFAFSAELVGNKMVPDTGDPQHMGGLGFPVTLKPGQSHEIPVDLSKWFDFRESGIYNLRGSYHMDFIDPAAKDLYTIWEDYACAEFSLEIRS